MSRTWMLVGMALLKLTAGGAAPEEGVDTLMERGKARFGRADYEGALEEFTQVTQKDPKRAEAYLWRGRARGGCGLTRWAMADLDKAIELDPKNMEFYSWRGSCRLSWDIGNSDDTIADYTKAIDNRFEPDKHYFGRGGCLCNKGELENALADLNKAVAAAGRDEPHRRYWRGAVRMKLDDFKGALDDLSKHIQEAPQPEDTAWLFRGYVNLRLDKAAEADADFRDYLKKQPSAKKVVDSYRELARLLGANDQPQTGPDFIKRAEQIYSLEGWTDWAVLDALKAVAVDPGYAEGYWRLGTYLELMRYYTSAVAAFDQAIKAKPLDERFYTSRAATNAKREQWDTALADADKAIAIDARYADAYFWKANVYCNKRQWALAAAESAKMIEFGPNDATNWYWHHVAMKHLGKLDESIAALDECIRLNPNYSRYIERGEVHHANGDVGKAEADFAKAIELEPTSGWAYCSRGHLRLDQGDTAGALADLNKAVQLSRLSRWDYYPFAYYLRGLAKEKVGDPTAAADKDKAVMLWPGLPDWIRDEYDYMKSGRTLTQRTTVLKPALPPLSEKVSPLAKQIVEAGKALAAKGDLEQAVATYNRALQIAPRYAEAYVHRGLARMRLKKTEEAEQDFAEALQINPGLKPTLDEERTKANKETSAK